MLPIYLAEQLETQEDVEFVEKIYEKDGPRLFYVANKIIEEESLAWGAVHDAIIVLIKHLEEFKLWEEQHQKNYMRRCTINLALKERRDRWRYAKRTCSLEEYEENVGHELMDNDTDLAKWFCNKENMELIRETVYNMKNIYGDVLFFKYFANMRNKDIAATFGLSVDTVNMRVSRAMAMLRKELKEKLR